MRRGAIGVAALAAALALAGFATADVVQQGGLRITVLAQVQPHRLPRTGTAPIAVFIAGHIASADGSTPPQLQRMSIEVNRHGHLEDVGLPRCALARIRAVSSQRALRSCGDALVGSGRFWATIVLPDQRPYPTRGRLLVFNGRRAGRPVLFAQIFTTKPFATSFVITFAIKRIDGGTYGTELSASLPQALGSWGFVDRIKLTLRRKYRYRGVPRSYFNASCPAPSGTNTIAFPLAHANFYLSARDPIGLTVSKACGVKE